MRLILAFGMTVTAGSAMAADPRFSERTVTTGHAITVAFLNLGPEQAKTVFHCSSSLPEGIEIMGHDRMGGVVMVAPSVVVLKSVGDEADGVPYIRIECRAP
jgi:hypothetical protein